jgi:hypothetical protein
MRDPLFLILKSLKILLERVGYIVFFIFDNYFPSATPEEPDNLGFNPLGKII